MSDQTLLEIFQESIKHQPYYRGENQQREESLKRYKKINAVRRIAKTNNLPVEEIMKMLDDPKSNARQIYFKLIAE